MWARSTLRINVLATLAAILDTPLTKQGNAAAPVITEAHWNYFEAIVMNDINNFKGKAEQRIWDKRLVYNLELRKNYRWLSN